MNLADFFKTLRVVNPANVGKVLYGAASGLVSYPAIMAVAPLLPAGVVIVASIVLGVGTVFGLHAVHTAEPPAPKLGS